MKKLVEFSALGVIPTPWSVPDIGNVTAADGRRVRFAKRAKKSDLTKGIANLEDWQKHVRNCASSVYGKETEPHRGPVRVVMRFTAKTPEGSKAGQLWDVDLKWNPKANKGDGDWTKTGKRGYMADLVNLFKGTEDAMEGTVYHNDVKTRLLTAGCFYGKFDGVQVTVYAIEPEDFPGDDAEGV
jgi:Holliday junction resolvase RusA-like endonuclease